MYTDCIWYWLDYWSVINDERVYACCDVISEARQYLEDFEVLEVECCVDVIMYNIWKQ